MTDGELSINFTGITHDHSLLHLNRQQQTNSSTQDDHHQPATATPNDATPTPTLTPTPTPNDEPESCSTIAILRRHPLYDSLVLVKRFRECLGGYALEFPADMSQQRPAGSGADEQQQQQRACSQRKLVSIFLDGDDPWFAGAALGGGASAGSPGGQDENLGPQVQVLASDGGLDTAEVVHVPINGLLDRLKAYTDSGVSVDSRVYAFAMGLKTAERIMASSSMREINETPL